MVSSLRCIDKKLTDDYIEYTREKKNVKSFKRGRKMTETKTKKPVRLPNLLEALLPIIVMLGLMVYNLNFSGGLYADAHMPLLVGICVACCVGLLCGHDFADMTVGMLDAINRTMEAVLILCTVGILVASFISSGAIPALIYYGLKFVSPKVFLPVGCLFCGVVGLACGSSWTTTATVGIAFMGIGAGLGINPAITAGMIISGAYVGDKFSPLSDTTNLAAAVAETGLFDHVTAMVSTTGPTLLIAVVLYAITGANFTSGSYDPAVSLGIQDAIASSVNVNPVVLLPILVIIVVCVLKMPALPGIMLSVFTSIVFAFIFQDGFTNIASVFDVLHYGTSFESGNELVDKLLSRGGMDHQMWTINLIILAMAYGGALERCGCVEALFGKIKEKTKTVGGLVLLTMVTSLFCDAAMCDQFMGISIPGPLYREKYDELGLARNMCSRTLEDCGTLWAVMFPWTACGAYQMGVLGINPLVYFPFAFVNLLNPIIACICAYAGRNIFWADGAYTPLIGKTRMRKVAKAPEAEHEYALKQLEALRAAGKAPIVEAR